MTSPQIGRVSQICLGFPEAIVERVEGEAHLIYRVRTRTFAYYLENHHGDDEIALCCKVEAGMNQALVDADSSRFFMPTYLGHRGWVSIRLERVDVDWEELADLVETSYRLVAPKTLVRQLS